MVASDIFRKMALSFPNALEKKHFERTAFSKNGKIFATLKEQSNTATLNLTLTDQLEFCEINKISVYPVPNRWGEKGWTSVELNDIPEELAMEMLMAAYSKIKH